MKLTKRKAWCVAPCQRFANFNAWVVPFPKGGVIVSKRLIQFKKTTFFVVFYYFRAKNGHFWNNFELFHYIHPKRKDKGYPQSSEYPNFLFLK